MPSAHDIVNHTCHGRGVLLNGWIGRLEVEFPTGRKKFTDADDLVLVPGSNLREWHLLSQAELTERERRGQAALARRESRRRAALAAHEQLRREALQERDRLQQAALAEVAEREALRQVAFAQLRRVLNEDFLQSDQFFEAGPAAHLTHNEYEQEKIAFVKRWVARAPNSPTGQLPIVPDDEQALAIATVGGNVQLVARAGSGKTETIANRAAFLQKHCGVAPGEMLLLAFNRDAAKEIAQRLERKLGGEPLPHIMTFHSLAYALVPGAKALLVNTSDGSDRSLEREFQSVLLDAMTRPEFEILVRRLMLGHFRADWESIVRGGLTLSRDEMLSFRRSLVSETLRGEYVKSYGEKVIANFLFEHDIPYFYEQHHWVSGRNYRPDFTVPRGGVMPRGVVVEYFGLSGEPDYDEISAKKRAYWQTKEGEWAFIELGPNDWSGDSQTLGRTLKQRLAEVGVQARRLSEDEIWERTRQRTILRFTAATSGFVGRCRKQWLTPAKVHERMLAHDFAGDIEKWFVQLALELYELYLSRLDAINADDFDGLLQRAAYALNAGVTKFSRSAGDGDLKMVRYIFIDEYQDFTELFYQLIAALRHVNPEVQLFCVGDDWQAINRFAGSDLKFYRDFDLLFEPARGLQLTTNRRSKKSIVLVSNALMAGRGTPASAASNEEGDVVIVDLAEFRPTTLEETLFKRSQLTPVVLRLAGAALIAGRSVVLLSAKNELTDPAGGAVSLDRYLKSLHGRLPVGLRDRITISTAHGFKGRQCDVVIILDAMERSFPLIHPNWIFNRVLGESEAEIVDESRRLFYVALTRAKHAVYIVTERGRRSPFLDEIATHTSLRAIDWEEFPPILQENDWVIVKVMGAFEAMQPLITGLKADSFRYRDLSSGGGDRSWDRVFRTSDLVDGFLTNTPWMDAAKVGQASGINVLFFDGIEQIKAKGVIHEGALAMKGRDGDSAEFDITQLRRAFGSSNADAAVRL